MPVSGIERLVPQGQSSVRPTRLIAYAWGDKYVDDLLSLTLPAALAPHNLASIAELAPTEVVLLIQEQHCDRVADHPTTRRMRQICPVRLVGLDDLIVSKGKYGMTLTYALHRGMRAFGADMTETNFLFLNADFIIADGSLRNALLPLLRGERLVAAPSYCANAQAIRSQLRRFLDRTSGALTIPPRTLARLVLRNLHNTVKGKTLNQSDFHLLQVDQFYWRVDDDTLLGHQMPVAIVGMRPERTVDEPNSFWDHGLISEFCPKAKPYILGDSDDFLMAEPREKEVAAEQIVTGPLDPRAVAERMIGWVTPYQRGFAELPLTLHATDLPPAVPAERNKLAIGVAEILSHAPSFFPSHRDHPQWNYHLGAFMEARHQELSLKLGCATETLEPPADVTPIDQAWWRLDGARKRYDRHCAVAEAGSLFFSRDVGSRDPLKAEVAALERSYAQLIGKPVISAVLPHVRILGHEEDNAALLRNSSKVRRILPTLQRQLRLAAYHSSMRRARTAITEALAKGARNILLVSGDLKLAEALTTIVPGQCACVSSAGARTGNLAAVLDPTLKFDLCLWELGPDDLSAWREIVDSVRSCLNSGAMIVGFCLQRDVEREVADLNELGDEVYLDKLSRAEAIFARGRRAIAIHGLFKAVSLAVQHKAARRLGTAGDDVVAWAAKSDHTQTAVTVIARVSADPDVRSEAKVASIPIGAEQHKKSQARLARA
jgi:hypothetical protein